MKQKFFWCNEGLASTKARNDAKLFALIAQRWSELVARREHISLPQATIQKLDDDKLFPTKPPIHGDNVDPPAHATSAQFSHFFRQQPSTTAHKNPVCTTCGADQQWCPSSISALHVPCGCCKQTCADTSVTTDKFIIREDAVKDDRDRNHVAVCTSCGLVICGPCTVQLMLLREYIPNKHVENPGYPPVEFCLHANLDTGENDTPTWMNKTRPLRRLVEKSTLLGAMHDLDGSQSTNNSYANLEANAVTVGIMIRDTQRTRELLNITG